MAQMTGTLMSKPTAILIALLLMFAFPVEVRAQHSGLGQTEQIAGNNINLSLSSNIDDIDFLRVKEAFKLKPNLENGQVALEWVIADGYYLYKKQLQFQIETGRGPAELEVTLPSGTLKSDDFFGDVEVYYNQLIARSKFSGIQDSNLIVRSQGCADLGLCYPPLTQKFTYNIVSSQFEEITSDLLTSTNRNALVGSSLNSDFSDDHARPDFATSSNALMIFFAFIGGMTLNLMPCVFPVLALKLLGLVSANSLSPANRRNHGIAYTAGILVCFLAIASLMLGLRAAGETLGWGFQLQSPWVVGLLVYLFVILGQSMSGYVEFTPSWINSGQRLTQQTGHTGSFFTGMLAVVVATPCTAPFMGTAVGFALVQSSIVAVMIFLSLGLGMAFPFLLTAYIPRFARMLPRPGPWMATFKEVMAFPLYATAVWLLWIAGRQTSESGMAMIALGCVLIFLALWLWRRQSSRSRFFSIIILFLALGILTGPWMQKTAIENQKHLSNAYSAERVSEFRARGQSVFVNLTADWCITCMTNEKLALSRSSVLKTFSEQKIAYLKGDWTNSDPRITALLRKFNRSGVPLYLLYPADTTLKPMILPQILTHTIILDAIEELREKEAALLINAASIN